MTEYWRYGKLLIHGKKKMVWYRMDGNINLQPGEKREEDDEDDDDTLALFSGFGLCASLTGKQAAMIIYRFINWRVDRATTPTITPCLLRACGERLKLWWSR